MSANHFLVSHSKLGQLNRFHLIENSDPPSLAFGLLQAPVQAVELNGQELVIRLR